MSPFASWESFYVIIGSAAAALTGLQFVVVVLASDLRAPASEGTTRAFGTPTVVHFSAVLLVSAILSAPWRRAVSAAAAIDIFAGIGLAYTLFVVRHQHRQSDYKPVFEDWLFHAILPLAAYAALLASGVLLPGDPAPSLFVIGAAALLLLFVGIHNAWDAVTYMASLRRKRDQDEPPGRAAKP